MPIRIHSSHGSTLSEPCQSCMMFFETMLEDTTGMYCNACYELMYGPDSNIDRRAAVEATRAKHACG